MSEKVIHPLKVFKTTAGRVSQVFQRYRGEAVGNSYHHQRLVFVEGRGLELSAINPDDNTPEAIESTDGNLLLLQFHIELMAKRSRGSVQRLGFLFLDAMIDMLTPLRSECGKALAPVGRSRLGRVVPH